MGISLLVLLTAAAAGAFALANYWAASRHNKWIGRAVLGLSTAPLLILLAYAGILVALAIRTNDMNYAFADMGFAVVLVATMIFVPIVYAGFKAGRRQRSRRDLE